MSLDILWKNLMILASAGSGKTFQLGNRVIGLVGARSTCGCRGAPRHRGAHRRGMAATGEHLGVALGRRRR